MPYVVLLAPAAGAQRNQPIELPPVDAAKPSQAPGADLTSAPYHVGGPENTILFDIATASWSFVERGGQPPTSQPVYVNQPPGDLLFVPGADRLMADDVRTVTVNGCDVSGYEVRVGRSPNQCSVNGQPCETAEDCAGPQSCDPRPDPGFSLNLAIYDGCPGDGGVPLEGTEATIDLPTDGLFNILVSFSTAPIAAGHALWVSAQFDKPDAGWIVGTPASMGYTADFYHHPLIPCVADFGFAPVYAGFHTRVFCTDAGFDIGFPAYFNAPQQNAPLFAPDAGQWLADDVQLATSDCVLSSYEIASVSSVPFTMDAAIWRECDEATVVEGTQATFQGTGDGSIEVARFHFPDGVPLDHGADYWVAWKYGDDETTAILAGEAELGFSENLFGLPGIGCSFWFGGTPYAAFAITITCLGDPPVGACCRRTLEAVCEQTIQSVCTGPSAEWIEGAACAPDPFDPPCGVFACCLPDPAPEGECQNLSPETCTALGGILDGGARRCGALEQDCGWFVCRGAAGDCTTPNGEIGCDDFRCCSEICDVDSFCCQFEWDEKCAKRAVLVCNPFCPDGPLGFLDPPADVVDARQPNRIDDPSQPQGIDRINVVAPGDSSLGCWSLCETGDAPNTNYITSVTPHADGTMTLILARPITPGNVTTLTYTEHFGETRSFSLTAHPGNVNGDSAATPSDLLALIDHLNGVGSLPWGLYSCDLDRSGVCGPEDILRAVDLLSGHGAFDPWIGTPLPESTCP